MKLARYQIGPQSFWGQLRDDGSLVRHARAPWLGMEPTGHVDRLADVRLLAPAESPRIFGVGLNYVLHARESGKPLPEIPMLFMKPDTALCGPDDPIIYPREGQRVDYECELAVVLKSGGRRLDEAQASQAILGLTCANDISERPIQRAEMAMGCLLVGKAFDSFCPLGPVIVTGLDPGRLDIRTRVNGEVRQHSNTSDLIFSVPKLVSYLSQSITLRGGDVIVTGTPEGIGPIRPGDVVEIEIEGIGVLRNPVVAEA
ncbi:MAG: fumarylacetoacetate hydrolase family protein [Betaproteobacteria bacterium]